MPYKDLAKARANAMRYYREHRDTVLAVDRAWARTFRSRLIRGRFNAKKRKIAFDIDITRYEELLKSGVCYYCGGELPETGLGLDRKDSYGPYTVENCVSCCSVCNSIRGKDLITFEEMPKVVSLLKSLRNEPQKATQ